MPENSQGESSAATVAEQPAGISLRTHLLRLVGFAVLPIVVMTLALLIHLIAIQRDTMQRSVLERARLTSLAVDQEMTALAAIANNLADYALLELPDFAGILEFSKRAVDRHPGIRVLMMDVKGNQHFDTAQIPAERQAAAAVRYPDSQASWREVIRTAKPQYSDLTVNNCPENLTLSYCAPILRMGQVAYLIAIVFSPTQLTAILKSQQSDETQLLALVDRNGLVIARNVGAERYVGNPAAASLLASMQKSENGVNWGEALGGQQVLFGYSKSSLTGWTIATAAPIGLAYAPLLKSLIGWGTLVVALIGLAVWLARRTWTELGTPLIALAQNAVAFERGESIQLPASRIREIQNCSRAWNIAIHAEQARIEQARLRQLAEARRQESERIGHEKDRLLAALSHELRSPLSSIGNSVHILERLARDEARFQLPLSIIRRQSEHLGRLIDNMLDLARATFGKMQLERVPIDLLKVIRETASAYDLGIDGPSRISVLGESAWVDGDPTRLSQVIRNLLDNAIKFSPADGNIQIRLSVVKGHVEMVISDNGAGIPAEMTDRLFEAFAQSEQSLARTQGGLGLGLALVRQIVELHGGTVKAESPGPNLGAKFIVRLALSAPAPAPAPDLVPVEVPEKKIGNRVLIIEDQEDSRLSLSMLLELMGHRVYVAGDGREGLDRLRELRPDLAFIDIGLPDLDGLTVARTARNDPGLSRIRLVAMTGYSQPELRLKAREAGFEAFLLKPVNLEALQSILLQAASGDPRE